MVGSHWACLRVILESARHHPIIFSEYGFSFSSDSSFLFVSNAGNPCNGHPYDFGCCSFSIPIVFLMMLFHSRYYTEPASAIYTAV